MNIVYSRNNHPPYQQANPPSMEESDSYALVFHSCSNKSTVSPVKSVRSPLFRMFCRSTLSKEGAKQSMDEANASLFASTNFDSSLISSLPPVDNIIGCNLLGSIAMGFFMSGKRAGHCCCASPSYSCGLAKDGTTVLLGKGYSFVRIKGSRLREIVSVDNSFVGKAILTLPNGRLSQSDAIDWFDVDSKRGCT